jgi:hypothetical protein
MLGGQLDRARGPGRTTPIDDVLVHVIGEGILPRRQGRRDPRRMQSASAGV